MTNNHWPEWGGYTAIAIAMALIAWLNWIGGGLFASFYGILVTLVALRYGWLGGLLAAILSAVLLLIGETPALETAVDAGSLITVGVSVGLLTAREQRRKRRYKNLAEKLGNVYEKVQANFEGMKWRNVFPRWGSYPLGWHMRSATPGQHQRRGRHPPPQPGPRANRPVHRYHRQRMQPAGWTAHQFPEFARPRPPDSRKSTCCRFSRTCSRSRARHPR